MSDPFDFEEQPPIDFGKSADLPDDHPAGGRVHKDELAQQLFGERISVPSPMSRHGPESADGGREQAMMPTDVPEPDISMMDGKPSEPVESDMETGSSGIIFVTLIIAALALAGSGYALWQVYSFTEKKLERKKSVAGLSAGNMRKAIDEINHLRQRVDDLASQIEALPSGQSDQWAEEAKTIRDRLAKLEAAAEAGKKASRKARTRPSSAAPAKPSGKGGAWVVNLSSHAKFASANREASRLEISGLKPEVIKVESKGKIWYRVRIIGFSTAAKARAYSDYVKQTFGIRDAWVGRQ
jgi:hypothetical protein